MQQRNTYICSIELVEGKHEENDLLHLVISIER